VKIYFHNENIRFNLKEKVKIRNWIFNCVKNECFGIGTLNYVFTDNPTILQINQQYLNHNYFTDIITFNYSEGNVISGDIFISIDTVKENSEEYSGTFDDELFRVIIHGVLHLIGYNDKLDVERQVMRDKENFYLKEVFNS
jgi:probable rRNA maturation factor